MRPSPGGKSGRLEVPVRDLELVLFFQAAQPACAAVLTCAGSRREAACLCQEDVICSVPPLSLQISRCNRYKASSMGFWVANLPLLTVAGVHDKLPPICVLSAARSGPKLCLKDADATGRKPAPVNCLQGQPCLQSCIVHQHEGCAGCNIDRADQRILQNEPRCPGL